jgi:hypothetical protein
VLIIHDEGRCDLSLDRPPDLLDGIEIRGVWWEIHELDIVFGGVTL